MFGFFFTPSSIMALLFNSFSLTKAAGSVIFGLFKLILRASSPSYWLNWEFYFALCFSFNCLIIDYWQETDDSCSQLLIGDCILFKSVITGESKDDILLAGEIKLLVNSSVFGLVKFVEASLNFNFRLNKSTYCLLNLLPSNLLCSMKADIACFSKADEISLILGDWC